MKLLTIEIQEDASSKPSTDQEQQETYQNLFITIDLEFGAGGLL